jgi:hypothetical protein
MPSNSPLSLAFCDFVYRVSPDLAVPDALSPKRHIHAPPYYVVHGGYVRFVNTVALSHSLDQSACTVLVFDMVSIGQSPWSREVLRASSVPSDLGNAISECITFRKIIQVVHAMQLLALLVAFAISSAPAAALPERRQVDEYRLRVTTYVHLTGQWPRSQN